jgi:ribosome-associated translation inhibitor RaiA
VDIVFHSHHAEVSDHMRRQAQRGLVRLERRLTRAVHAVVRFEADGRLKRVEIVLHTPRRRELVAESSHRFFGPALAMALARLEAISNHSRKPSKRRLRVGTTP